MSAIKEFFHNQIEAGQRKASKDHSVTKTLMFLVLSFITIVLVLLLITGDYISSVIVGIVWVVFILLWSKLIYFHKIKPLEEGCKVIILHTNKEQINGLIIFPSMKIKCGKIGIAVHIADDTTLVDFEDGLFFYFPNEMVKRI